MKTKHYLDCRVTMNNGRTFDNPLKLSEAHLISKLCKDNKQVLVTRRSCDAKEYKIIFG